MSHRPLRPAAGAFFVGLLSLAQPTFPQGRKLSGPMPRLGLGEIREYRLTPDGGRVVYRADEDTDGVFELYSAPADGTASSIKLNGPLVPGGAVTSTPFQISPDGARVVYAADAEVDDAVDLFSVPVDGSAAPVRLDGALPSGRSIGRIFALVAGRAVYEGFEGASQASELFSAPLDGSAPARKLNAPLASGHFLQNPLVSPDGRWVVYVTDQDRTGVFELYRAPVDGSAPPARLHPPLSDDVDVSLLAIAPDSSRVALFATGPFGSELYSIGLTGPEDPLLLTAGLPQGRIESVRFSPDSASVVFQFDDGLESARLVHGATPVRLDDPLADGVVVAYAIAPDSRHVVFANGSRDYEIVLDRLSSAPLDGSAPPVELGVIDALIEFPPEALFQIDAQGRKVVFRRRPVGENALLARVIDGSAPAIRLDTPTGLQGEVQSFRVAPAGERVIYTAAPDDPYQSELFSVTSAGSAPALRLNGALRGGEVESVQIASDGTRVAFLADQDADITERLFTAPLDGSAAAVALGSPLPLGPVVGDVLEFQAAGPTVVYRADQEADGRPGLYVVPSDGRSEARELSSSVGVSGAVIECQLSPDGVRVLYRQATPGEELVLASTEGSASPLHLASGSFSELRFTPDGAFVLFRQAGAGLFAAPSDGSRAPVQLSGLLLLDHTWIAPDSRRVVFVTDPTTSGAYELFSSWIDGSAPAVKLSATLVPGGEVSDVLVAPDASFVVYHADAAVDEVVELFRAPIDGSAPPQRLNGALVAGGDVQRAEIAADGTRVVYLADQRADEVFELFAVPSDGSAAPVLLSGPLVTGGDVASFHVAPDGRHVAFVADREQNDRFELYVAPLDGSAAPRKLNPALVPGGDVNLGFAFTPRGDRVVYRADQSINELLELFAVPTDGSGPALRLNGPLEPGGGVLQFALGRDGRKLVYRANRDARRVSELFAVATDARRPARCLNRPLSGDQSVQGDFVLAGDRVLYRADQGEPGVFELYMSLLGAGRPRAH